MKLSRGGAALGVLIVLALFGLAAYSAYAVNLVSQDFQQGKGELLAAQSAIGSAQPTGNATSLVRATSQLGAAQRDFSQAQRRVQNDPALRFFGVLPASGPQVQAAARLGAIGADLSRAGESAALVGIQVAVLEKQYHLPLTLDQVIVLLQRAQGLTASYQGSINAIGRALRDAHAQRAQVRTTELVPPLRQAYDQVDQALGQADAEFLRYQDITRMVADFLGINLSG